MSRHFALLLLFFSLGWPSPGWSRQELEIIPLQRRSAEQVLPALQPLVEPGGSLSGMNNQLFLRASARNREEIKRALAAIDVPAKRLIIRVSQERGGEARQQGGALQGQVTLGSARRVAGQAQVWDSGQMRRERAGQMVQTIEGGRAFIQVGRSLPVPLRQVVLGPGGAVVTQTLVYRDIGQGFYAEPRLNGDRVTLEITQQADSPIPYSLGAAETQRLSTTVSGRLGEWIELGGTGQQGSSEGRGALSLSTSSLQDSRSLWLMVEEAP